MNQDQIKTLIDALAASDLSELEYSENGCSLRLVRQSALAAAPARREVAMAHQASAPQAPHPETPGPAVCCAPLYGVVHLQPRPGDTPYVQAGQAVTAGQTLCVIEAMKVFNEVRAERDATVQAVLVESGQEVEADQPLFRLE
ncbi:acetyl-CoA carboxylase biotin carboxyl carrier protein [Variovorax sp. RT4R15]|uniref:acetyl-CoA carboxylase biotin carboxyl carrier protein n=1 Tax=Variovorax sp. RT4R15 TaxID=3443737 RepID=UPI003F45B353